MPRRAQNPPNPRCAHAGLHRAAAAATAASSAGVQFPKTQAFCTSYSAPWPRPAAGPPSAGHAAPFRSVLASAIPGFLGSAAWNAWAPRNIASSRDGRRLTGTGRRATGALARALPSERPTQAVSKQQASPRGRIADEIQPGRMQSPGEVLISRRPCAGVRPRTRKLARLVGGGGPHELVEHPRSSGHLPVTPEHLSTWRKEG